MIAIPTVSCRYCEQILLILTGVRVSVAEYFEKVVLHEADCAGPPEDVANVCEHYMMLEDDAPFGLYIGDVLVCTDYPLDPEKLTVCFRLDDEYNPACNVYRHQVVRMPGTTMVRFRSEEPYGFERVPE